MSLVILLFDFAAINNDDLLAGGSASAADGLDLLADLGPFVGAFSIGLASNPAMLLALAITVVAQLAVIYVPAFSAVFRTVPLSAAQLGACFAIGSLVFVAIEAEKWVRYRRDSR